MRGVSCGIPPTWCWFRLLGLGKTDATNRNQHDWNSPFHHTDSPFRARHYNLKLSHQKWRKFQRPFCGLIDARSFGPFEIVVRISTVESQPGQLPSLCAEFIKLLLTQPTHIRDLVFPSRPSIASGANE